MDTQSEETLRQAFKHINRCMLLLWRLGLARYINSWPEVVGRIMVITHTGRKSGLQRHTPVNYAIVDGDIYCTAAFAKSDWYLNILANPNVGIWLPGGWWAGVAEDISDADNRITLLRHVLIASAFAGRAAGINPHTMSDLEFETATVGYRLLRLHRTEALTGPGGPGELAWIWPLSSFILLISLFLRPKRKMKE